MDYTNIEQRGRDTILTGLRNFIPAQILDNGQCFRWQASEFDPDKYSGIAHGRRLNLIFKDGELILKKVHLDEYKNIWQDYFDLGRDYEELRGLYAGDKTLAEAIKFSPGLRLMQQEPWETLLTFILSQNSNIPRIKGMVARLCEKFGQPLACGAYTFPKPESLAVQSAESLASIRSGYRAKYIIDAAKRVAGGQLDLESLHAQTSKNIRLSLMEIHGVGPKVADCVLLYAYKRTESYPMDVWMKRVMSRHYPKGFPSKIKRTAGIAQQFLFHYIRSKD